MNIKLKFGMSIIHVFTGSFSAILGKGPQHDLGKTFDISGNYSLSLFTRDNVKGQCPSHPPSTSAPLSTSVTSIHFSIH
jgi:hypothetical protein